jgi:hypothetical protein
MTQYGITWTFDGVYLYGQFVNGDYWVVGPAIIVGINPPPIDREVGIKHYHGNGVTG